jgi:hypothetical protein
MVAAWCRCLSAWGRRLRLRRAFLQLQSLASPLTVGGGASRVASAQQHPALTTDHRSSVLGPRASGFAVRCYAGVGVGRGARWRCWVQPWKLHTSSATQTKPAAGEARGRGGLPKVAQAELQRGWGSG